jgi:hypothetical protein
MANEKSRNHETGGNKGGASKHQGESKDQQDDASTATGKQAADKSTSGNAQGASGDAA